MFYKNKYPKIINIPLIGSIKSGFNIENFITLKPKPDVFIVDLYAILGSDYNKLFKYLEKVGIPCIVIDFRVNPIKNTIQSMVILGDALKKKNKAKLFSKIYTQHLNYVVNKINNNNIQRQKVFIERGAGYSNAVALRSFGNENMGSFINLLHGRNIANYLTKNVISQGEITQETVMISNPDIYIFQSADKQNESGIPLGFLPYTCLEEIKKASNNLLNKKWLQLLTAYENKKVYTIYMPLFNSPYNIVAIEYFAKWMYPDLFEKLSPHKTINEIYTSLLNTKAPNVLWGINNFTYKEK
jgi:iron complex transport system substrate-binding protein